MRISDWISDVCSSDLARPETVKSQLGHNDVQERYRLKATGEVLITGRAIGQKIGSGKVRIVADISEMDQVKAGDILVTDMTDQIGRASGRERVCQYV